MVSKLVSSAIDHGFETRSGLTKDYKIGICCFSAKHAALRRKSKYRLARNQDNVFTQRTNRDLPLQFLVQFILLYRIFEYFELSNLSFRHQ